MGHRHSVYDTDTHLKIDPVTKQIKNETLKKTRIVQGDFASERVTFEMPRFIEGHDTMLCDLVEVHYDNYETGTSNVSSDYCEVKDMQISPDDEDVVIFSWLIEGTATVYGGSLEFSIKFKCVENGAVTYEWNTDTNKDLTVLKGKNNSGVVVKHNPNIVDQWRSEIFGDAENAVANINLAEKNALASVKSEGAAQVKAIQDEGKAQVENVKAAAAAIEADRNQIHLNNALKAAAIVGSAEGEVILLDDSAAQPFVEMSVFGKSTQKTTSGHQLIDVTLGGETTVSGLKIAPTDDGDLIVNGTHVEGAMWLEVGRTSLVAGKTYTLSCSEGFSLHLWDLTNGKEFRTKKLDVASITIEASESIECAVVLNDAVLDRTYSNYKVSAILNEGDAVQPWEAFTGCIPSPNPQFPQEINGVENPEIMVYGKNLLKPKVRTETINGVTFAVHDDGTVTVNGTATKAAFFSVNSGFELKQGESYVLNGCPDGGAFDTYMLYLHYDSGVDIYNRSGETKFTSPKGRSNAVIVVYEGITVNNLVFHPMVRLSAIENGDFEPCKGQNLSLPHTLHGIPVSSGGNYTDADGQQWVCDEIDLERGVLVQRVELKTFILSKSAYEFTPLGYRYQHHAGTGFTICNTCLCKTMPYNNEVGTDAATTDGVRLNKDAGYVIAQYTDELGTAETIDLDILYILPTPIETALSETEIEAFKALMTNYPTTTILNDCGANMAVRYGIDTKTYIDKKIAELLSASQ